MSEQLKIVLIGAGSREFGPATIRDILLSDPINERDLKLVLMDINPKELTIHQKYAENVAEQLDRHPKIVHTTKLEEALAGADAVVTAIETKRYFYWAQDFHIPRKHGFKQIYGENGGPGGLFHALRNAAPLADVAGLSEGVDAELYKSPNQALRNCSALVLVKHGGIVSWRVPGYETTWAHSANDARSN